MYAAWPDAKSSLADRRHGNRQAEIDYQPTIAMTIHHPTGRWYQKRRTGRSCGGTSTDGVPIMQTLPCSVKLEATTAKRGSLVTLLSECRILGSDDTA
jgi:hypothetical protein